MKVRVRGTVYDSVRACATALGLSESTVYAALSRGTTDRLGTGPGRARAGVRPANAQAVVIGGLRFDSMTAASAAVGFNPGYVHQVLTHGGPRARENLLRAAMECRARLDRDAAREALRWRWANAATRVRSFRSKEE